MPGTNLKNTLYRLALPFSPVRPDRSPAMIGTGSLSTPETYLRLLRKHHVMGSALLLKEDIRRVEVYASANLAQQVKADSLFRVASITKMATALAALRGVEEGKLSLDAPFLSYFPELPPLPELQDVCLQHLLSHTSGLMDPPHLEQDLNERRPFPETLSGCRLASPGQIFRYSNLGFGLIGSLLERVYGLPVSSVLDLQVFQPLGMRATLDASTLNPDQIVPLVRIPIRPFQKPMIMKITPLGRIPLKEPEPLLHYGHTAGAMYTDIVSLEKLTDCVRQFGSPLICKALGEKMRQPYANYGKASPTLSYGLGLLQISDPALSASRILGHQGFAYGCADGAFWEEDTGRTVLFLNGGASEARTGRLGLCNRDMLRWALRKEMANWSGSVK